MPDVLQIGPLQLEGHHLALLLACSVGLWLVRRQVLRLQDGNKLPITDIIFNGAMIVVLTWKLGVVFTQPSMLWTQPAKILFVSGSGIEVLLGLLIAIGYGWFQIRKLRIPAILMLDVLACGVTAAFLLYNALISDNGLPTTLPWGIGAEGTTSRFHPYPMYLAVLLVPLFLWQQFTQLQLHAPGSGRLFKYSLFHVGAAGMIASFFAQPASTVVFLSWPQLLFLFMLFIGMLLPPMAHNTNRRELSHMSQNDSKMQIQQEQQNKEHQKIASIPGKEGFVDKKLDGPNRPST
ncbi:hypothetical protein GK047_18785 [Paenibacillus sp. SYP-B3998]|uniref:Prolipoprotein diacylglyceryl transferase n=1 Tax=Paenibacillus sp. SYP-B3998 TaxID=2678564 RepID=A0A6G4A133_9BACL|nr:prolipoprotein diacylglyceryl transferase family protein [Paenibacillus sp. SYP-B3998]NEW08050.1 hypothetical protein [Paenibacillus sp. SYP-B3998]